MIDRDARNRLAEGIRHLAMGLIKNFELEEEALSDSADPAVHAVFLGGPWYLSHDLMRYRLSGKNRLCPAVRRDAARWVLFLKTDLPYEWPVERRGFVGAWGFVLLNLLSLGFLARKAQRQFARHGDMSVWPFVSRSDFEATLTKPTYSAKSPSRRIQTATVQAASA
jgi:hypothetical protein